MANESAQLLEMKGIRKVFSGTVALDGMDFELQKGEIHAIVGENGAGKSTLMKILAGVHEKNDGEIKIEGDYASIGNIASAKDYGISMIYQELANLPKLSVAENIFLGTLPLKRGSLVDFERMFSETENKFDKYGIDINPRQKLEKLTIAEKQFVEIIKAINDENNKIVIMDEPTSSLAKGEIDKLFSIIEGLKQDGITIIYISHRLDEIFKIADRVSVFRDGKNRGVFKREDFDQKIIIEHMLGHSVEKSKKSSFDRNKVIFEVQNLKISNKIFDFNLKLHKGEILGIAGLMGSGKDELVKSLFGLWPSETKTLFYNGQEIKINNPEHALRHGISYLPEERKIQSLFQGLDVVSNMTPIWLFHKIKKRIIAKKTEREKTIETINRLSVKTAGEYEKIDTLSGGNQQKVVFGRLLLMEPEVMVLNDPTRGIDIGSKEEIYREIRALAENGTSIIIVSSELEEIQYLSNRVLVLSKGYIRGEFSDEDVTMKNILTCVTRVGE